MENSFLQLRDVRKELGLSLNDIAQKLKIQRNYLKYIEEGRWDELPEDVYAIGFIRNYAKFIGVKSDEIVKQFKDSRAGAEDTSEEEFEMEIPNEEPNHSDSEFGRAAQDFFDQFRTQRTLQIAVATLMAILLFAVLHVFGYTETP